MNYWVDSARDEAASLVTRLHYSHRMPSNIQCVVTAHEDGGLFGDRGDAVAAVLFSIPPTRWSEPVWELSRLIKVDGVRFPLTGLIAYACKVIKKRKACDLLVSFADSTEGHHGGIYQAASWNYALQRAPASSGVTVDGEYITGRNANHKWGTRSPGKLRTRLGVEVENVMDTGKYLYWRALSREGVKMAARLGLEQRTYPKPRPSGGSE
tara:strand:+ start:30 stop:659 length:630 start_codon:yes stop_codon:yes gene_type:complete